MGETPLATKRSKRRDRVPQIVVGRLPIYLQALSQLEGMEEITSQELGRMVGISAAQIRKDLSYFGGFGKQGSGYQVQNLRKKLRNILQVDREWPVILVGVGDLGHAIARYAGFQNRGFRVVATFDKDPAKIGQRVGNLEILDVAEMSRVVKEKGVKVAIVAVPAAEAQKVAEALAEAGIQSILNYAPLPLRLSSHIRLYNIDPVVGLQAMTYYLEDEDKN